MHSTEKNKPVITYNNATFGFNNNIILKNITLDIYPGEIVAVIGRSGVGKTTLLNAITGEIKPISGDIIVNGGNPRIKKTTVGLVPQLSQESATNLSLLELVTLGKPRKGLFTSRKEREEASEILNKIGLKALQNRRIDQLSGGQRQRVLIARALNTSSEVIICDEPTSGADPTLSNEIMDTLTELSRKKTTVIIATHDLTTVLPRATRVVALVDGEIKINGEPELFDHKTQKMVYG